MPGLVTNFLSTSFLGSCASSEIGAMSKSGASSQRGCMMSAPVREIQFLHCTRFLPVPHDANRVLSHAHDWHRVPRVRRHFLSDPSLSGDSGKIGRRDS